MKEQRFTPSVSAGLHGVRHGAYSNAQSDELEARTWSDEQLNQKLDRLLALDDVALSRRTTSRVRKRVYVQEALRRGLTIKKVEK